MIASLFHATAGSGPRFNLEPMPMPMPDPVVAAAPAVAPAVAGTVPSAGNATQPPIATPSATHQFGPLRLLQLLGTSQRCMAWRAADPRSAREVLLVLPRTQPVEGAALDRWTETAHRAGRLQHPQLAPVLEVGVQDGWPFVAYDASGAATLAERWNPAGLPGAEAVGLASQVISGLAFAHEAGVAHHDLQPFLLLVGDDGSLRVAGLGVACEMPHQAVEEADSALGSMPAQRAAAEHDVLATGLLLHALLVGQPALNEADIGCAIQRLPPIGRERVHLPWTLSQPLSDALRSIVNRATDRQARQRYRSARTLLRALEGWQQTEGGLGGGPLALLADKLRVAGVLPSSPGAAAHAARLASMDRERTNDLAEVLLQDLALAFEMLRMVNTAQVRGAQATGSGPVLTVRRAIALLGMDGVRHSALALRAWPGPLDEDGAASLQQLIATCKRAGRLAVALRPAGYDGEVVYLLTLLQNLGRLVAQYHFAEEAMQIRRLMAPAAAALAGEPDEPGMTEEAASYAVLGADIEAVGAAVARQWGLDDSVLVMIRRMPLSATVHATEDDDGLLRCVASCANEAIDALALPKARVVPALQRVVQRYGRSLKLTGRDLQQALKTCDGPFSLQGPAAFSVEPPAPVAAV